MSADYEELLAEFDELAAIATDFSERAAGRYTESSRLFAGSQLFTNLCGRIIALMRLLPKSRLHTTFFETWDTTSIATLVRAIVEAAHAFHYLAVEEIPEDERRARFILVELHYQAEYCRILAGLGCNADEYAAESELVGALKTKLQESTYFQTLPAKRQKNVLRAEGPYFRNNAMIAEYFGFDCDQFRALYKWLSNYAHNHPFSYIRVSEKRGRGLDNPTDRGYARDLLDLANDYVAGCLRGYCVLFPDLRDTVSGVKWARIESRGALKP
jgi:hypothetical protein